MNKIYDDFGKINYPEYTLKLINSTNSELDELNIDDIRNIYPVIDKDGNPGIFIEYYDEEFCVTSSVACSEIEIKKRTYKI